MTTPLRTTKLYVPPVRPGIVSRPRLIEQLNTGLHCKLVLVSALVGFKVLTIKPQGRYLRLGYLTTRVAAFSRSLGRALGWSFDRLRLNDRAIPTNLGNLVTVYARRPE